MTFMYKRDLFPQDVPAGQKWTLYVKAFESYRIFNCSVSDAIYKRKLKFLTKLQHSENTICKLFEKYFIDELDIVHGHLFS